MLCLSGFKLYSRWVPLSLKHKIMNISSSDVSCDYFELRACLFNLRAQVVNKRIKNRNLRSF